MRKSWRCFHCDELFTSERCARNHFGSNEDRKPACIIKAGGESSLVAALRDAEDQVEQWMMAVHNENTESAKAYYAQQSRHREQITAIEVSAYEKGIKEVNAIVGEALVKLVDLYEKEYDNAEQPDWLREALLLVKS